MKKVRILAFFIILSLIIVPFTVSAEQPPATYTALGDSIAFGVGGSDGVSNDNYGYVDMLTERDFYSCNDRSEIGLTSAGLLANLTDSGDTEYTATREDVGDADYITISIGGNDLLQIFSPLYNQDPDFLSGLSYREKLILTTQLMANTRNFGQNWKNIIKNIRLLNDEAEIYVTTLYNPFCTHDPLFYFADSFIKSINLSIKTYARMYHYEIADVYKAFKGDDSLVYDLDGAFPLHPTDAGYEVIYELLHDMIDIPI